MIFFSFTSPIFIFIYCLVIFLIIGLIAALIIFREYKNTNTVLIKENKSKKSLTVSKDIQKASSGDPTQVNKNIERFSELLILDEHADEIKNVTFDNVTSLATFCDDFRNFCAYNKKLYYSIDDIRSFIANLATSKIMILQGMSGTGKTSIALAFEDFIGNQTTVIAVQPMWKERSDMVGYFNEFTKKFNETPLLKELYRSNFDDQIYIIVLDEMNIARIEYYFAEFLSLLEYPNIDQRTLEITNDSWAKDPKLLKEGRLQIKPNVYFLGTANNDESTFSISDKVYDRAMIMNLNKKAKELNCNKVSFAHHKTDAIETLFLNEIYGGRIATFEPKMFLENESITFIRPFIYIDEKEIIRLVKEKNIPIFPSNCPNDKKTKREDIKNLLLSLNKTYPASYDNFLTMLLNKEKFNIFFLHEENKVNNDGLYYKKITNFCKVFDENEYIKVPREISKNSEHFHLYKNNELLGILLLTHIEKDYTIQKIWLKEEKYFIPFVFTLYWNISLKINPITFILKGKK